MSLLSSLLKRSCMYQGVARSRESATLFGTIKMKRHAAPRPTAKPPTWAQKAIELVPTARVIKPRSVCSAIHAPTAVWVRVLIVLIIHQP